MQKEFQYSAFISYKREDEKWAKWLQRKLENYRLPTIIAREKPDLPRTLKPVFKDTTDIQPGDLAEVLRENLEKSKYLIVICSQLAAQSVWVGKEISDFIALGKQKNIILFIVEGEPYSNNPTTECCHSVLKEKLPEMLGVNINEASKDWKYIKKQKAFIRVVSTMLDVSFDTLWQRQKKRLIKNGIIILFVLISFISLSFYQYKTNQPFNVQVGLNEMTYHNEKLLFENGKILLCYDKDTLVSKPINDYSNAAEFNNIPGKFYGQMAHVRFEMFGFETLEADMLLEEKLELSVKRDQKVYGNVIAFLRNNYKEELISGAEIEILGHKARTDKNGYFKMDIPIEEQNKMYVIKSNITLIDSIIYMPSDSTVMIRTQ